MKDLITAVIGVIAAFALWSAFVFVTFGAYGLAMSLF